MPVASDYILDCQLRVLTELVIFQGTLKDSLDRYSLYGLEDTTTDYDCGFKNEIEDRIKLVSTL